MIKINFKKRTSSKFLFFLFLLFYSFPLVAQVFPKKHYPKDYFIYPVDARISLAANFGELRKNHYHMGLDCRTDQVINRPVKAAADGYIARVSVAPFGYGQAIYINHPNGLTTVYGHLHSFFPSLARYVKNKQYELKSWNVSLEFSPSQFPVKQGQLIAHSGNTGGSLGPHCHFEIRDTKTDKVLNPLLFGLPIPDKVPPTLVRLYLYDRCKSTYSQSPESFSLSKGKVFFNNSVANQDYSITAGVIPVHTDKISFGITANDKQSGSSNPNGIYEGIIYLDELPLSAFQIDSISYAETRYVNAHIDYKTRAEGGPYIEHLSRLPGYPEGVYKDINGDGVIELPDQKVHDVKVIIKDANGNTSVLRFKIQKGLITETGTRNNGDKNNRIEFLPNVVNVFENENMQVYLPATTLYDSVAFSHSEKPSTSPFSYSGIYSILSGVIPAENNFSVTIKSNQQVSKNLSDKILLKRTWKGDDEVVKAKKVGDSYSASFNEFGDFELISDNEPPLIDVDFHDGANLSRYHNIQVVPKDNNHQIKNFKAELDGKWLMFSNDKGRKFIYTFDEHCPRGKHVLKITVQDEAGNSAEKILHFTR